MYFNSKGGVSVPIGKNKVRLQVVVSEEMAKKIEMYSGKMGISRSSLCSQFIGQAIMGYDKAYDMLDKMAENLGKDNAATVQGK